MRATLALFLIACGSEGFVEEPDAASAAATPDAPPASSPDAATPRPDAAPQTFGPVVAFSIPGYDPILSSNPLPVMYATVSVEAGTDLVTLHFLDKDTGTPAGRDQLFHWNGGSVGLETPAETVRDPANGTHSIAMTLTYTGGTECGALTAAVGIDPQSESGPVSGTWAFVAAFGYPAICQ